MFAGPPRQRQSDSRIHNRYLCGAAVEFATANRRHEPLYGYKVQARRPIHFVLQQHDHRATSTANPRNRYAMQSELVGRSEEHTSELQSRENLVCRLLLEKKKNKNS